MSHTYYALAFLILIFGLAVIFISIVKLNCCCCKRSRLIYTLVLVAAMVAVFQPYFVKSMPGIADLALMLSVLGLLWHGHTNA
ncbi:hypothetical protein [Saezia sanguinis]|uniref:hypothetical protein n=1 Tax=Saezia sanguinis TaxID=1965230 RepID=UPI00302F9E79